MVDFNIDSIVSLKMLCLIREKFEDVMFNQGKAESRRQEDSMWARSVGDNYLDFEFAILKKLKSMIVGVFQMRRTTLLLETKFSIKTFRSCAVQGGTDYVALVRSC